MQLQQVQEKSLAAVTDTVWCVIWYFLNLHKWNFIIPFMPIIFIIIVHIVHLSQPTIGEKPMAPEQKLKLNCHKRPYLDALSLIVCPSPLRSLVALTCCELWMDVNELSPYLALWWHIEVPAWDHGPAVVRPTPESFPKEVTV